MISDSFHYFILYKITENKNGDRADKDRIFITYYFTNFFYLEYPIYIYYSLYIFNTCSNYGVTEYKITRIIRNNDNKQKTIFG